MANFKNTEKMIYDLEKHRYKLTQEAIEKEFNVNLSEVLDYDGCMDPETLPERFLERASRILYNYIYSWAENRDNTEYVISLPRYRDGIEEAMVEYVYSLLMNNTDPSVFFTGNSLNAIEVPPSVQTILLNNGLIFRGRYYNLPQDFQSLKGIEY